MSDFFNSLMKKATDLTRTGQLAEATRAIQQALSRHTAKPPEVFSPIRAAPPDPTVIDVESRVVEAPPVSPASARSSAASPEVRQNAPAPPSSVSPPARTASPERWERHSFQHQGRSIDYKLFVPAGLPVQPRPVILMLHGCTQDAEDFARGTRMNDHARQHEAVVIYPEQTHRQHGQKCWNWFKSQHQARDKGEPAMLCALALHIARQEGGDANRIYAAGLSAGGAMAAILGHCYPDVFAAIGVHSGLPHGAASDLMSALGAMKGSKSTLQQQSGSVPTIVIHGDADATVHPSNGKAFVEGRTESERLEDRSAGGGRSTRTVYPRKGPLGDAEHWSVVGGGHAWFGGSPKGSYTAPGMDASAEFMRFFLAHARHEAPH